MVATDNLGRKVVGGKDFLGRSVPQESKPPQPQPEPESEVSEEVGDDSAAVKPRRGRPPKVQPATEEVSNDDDNPQGGLPGARPDERDPGNV